MLSDELEQWLLALPLEEPCEIDGETVYLSAGDGGAEIGVLLLPRPSQSQIAEAMRTGFQGALAFQAGLALSPEGDELRLTRWMQGAEAWSDVADALEDILNQAALWRAAMAAGNGQGQGHGEAPRRDEARLRRAFNGS